MNNSEQIHISSNDIKEMDRLYRVNLINSLSGFKSANLIGTRSRKGIDNLATISSVVHLGSNPPLLGFIMRPPVVPRHSYENIFSQGVYSINHISAHFVQRAHYCSAKFDRYTSEFDACNLSREWIDGFAAPFVKESPVRIGLKLIDDIPIPANDTRLIVGEIMHILSSKEAIDPSGSLQLESCDTLCISGLDQYHKTEKVAQYPYARPQELPNEWTS